MGTWAGNLMMKYYHKDFPSDIFILLETVGATLSICETFIMLHMCSAITHPHSQPFVLSDYAKTNTLRDHNAQNHVT